MQALPPVSQSDITHMLSLCVDDLRCLHGERLLITGGTGFFGSWLLEAIVSANQLLGANIETWILSRDPASFARRSPHLANAPGIHWLTGDITEFPFPEGSFSHVIHAATAASAKLNETRPLEMLNTIMRGTERILEFARSHNTRKLLLISSGAVYGPQPPEMLLVPETYAGAPNSLSPVSAYGEGKRVMELMGSIANEKSSLEIKIARCFAFIGPHLPLDTHFAAGNFLRDALNRSNIRVAGNGQPSRSYLYAADLVVWLFRILAQGKSLRPYNVGSDQAITIAQLASMISESSQHSSVEILSPLETGSPPPRYVPDISRAKQELNLGVSISLSESIRRTLSWLENSPLSQRV